MWERGGSGGLSRVDQISLEKDEHGLDFLSESTALELNLKEGKG